MDFIKAVEIAGKNKFLVGKKYKGGTIDDIIIRPTNPENLKKFEIEYVSTLNAQVSILPYTHLDVEIAVIVDKYRIREGILLSISLSDLKNEFDIFE